MAVRKVKFRSRQVPTMFRFMEDVIDRMYQNGKIRTSESYSSALGSFMKFRKDKDISLNRIDSGIIESYEAWLKKEGKALNTVSFYLRTLRAVYNRAVDEEIIESRNPFRRVYTGVDKTVKRALPIGTIRKIKSLDLSMTPSVDFARDMLMMSFYLRGMSLIDMAFLKKSDLDNGRITYRRHKTGQRLTIKWTPEMQAILDKYSKNSSEYLLPVITGSSSDVRRTYRNAGYNINHNLKKVAGMLSLSEPLTMYVARHSWASAARAKGIPLSVISEGMGHDSETTTQIYLAGIGTGAIDRANAIILKSL